MCHKVQSHVSLTPQYHMRHVLQHTVFLSGKSLKMVKPHCFREASNSHLFSEEAFQSKELRYIPPVQTLKDTLTQTQTLKRH